MKMFVLAAILLLLPAALSAQVLIPSRASVREAVTLPAPSASGEPTHILIAERAPPPPPGLDYKLRVIRPSARIDARMPIGRPDPRIDYKMLMPRDDANARARPRTAPKR